MKVLLSEYLAVIVSAADTGGAAPTKRYVIVRNVVLFTYTILLQTHVIKLTMITFRLSDSN